MSLPTCPTCVYAKGICKKTGVEIRPTTGCTYHTPKPITNADRIRAMSDEELTVYLAHLTGCVDCIARRESCGYDCRKAWADWLRQEVKE